LDPRHIDVRLQDETVWLTRPMMAELFQTIRLISPMHEEEIGIVPPGITINDDPFFTLFKAGNSAK
jgi:hypothetical protein